MDEEMLNKIVERYTSEDIPPCCVCGDELSPGRMGGGGPTYWYCSPQEEDPDNPERLRYKTGRTGEIGRGTPDGDHYAQSQFIQYQHGDRHVLELVADYRRQAEYIMELEARIDRTTREIEEVEYALVGGNIEKSTVPYDMVGSGLREISKVLRGVERRGEG